MITSIVTSDELLLQDYVQVQVHLFLPQNSHNVNKQLRCIQIMRSNE